MARLLLKTSQDDFFEGPSTPNWIDAAERAQTSRSGKQTRNGLLLLHPVRRFGTPEEVADAVLWLCSPGADFITGVALPVDGGFEAGAGVFVAA